MTGNFREKSKTDLKEIAYRAYKWNLNVSILIIIWILLVLLKFFGILPTTSIAQGIGVLILLFAILAHVQTRKLRFISMGSILVYISQIAAFPLVISVFMNFTVSGSTVFKIFAGLMYIIILLFQFLAAIFCYLTARKIKKEFIKEQTISETVSTH